MRESKEVRYIVHYTMYNLLYKKASIFLLIIFFKCGPVKPVIILQLPFQFF